MNKCGMAKMRVALVAVAMMSALGVASAKGGGGGGGGAGCGDGGSAGGGGGTSAGTSAGSGDSASAGSSGIADGTWLRRTRRTPTFAATPAPATQGTVAIGTQAAPDGTSDATRLPQ
ncbi:hypothetical protein WG902_13800 [Ramlibacter sp. PS3R-8]|uniref:hypothetical protein n=1 Tax=Ramlibacter sp. PS3R-8 TaxID=3133437 RepID=UPI00309E9BB7